MTLSTTLTPRRTGAGDGTVRAAAAAGVLWNAFGIFQFARTAFASPEALTATGMTAEQASLYAGLPAWMTLAFAVGVLAGTTGSLLLVLRRPAAAPVLGLSLAAYAVLAVGDVWFGVFAAFGAPQVGVIAGTVAAVAGLLALSVRSGRQAPAA